MRRAVGAAIASLVMLTGGAGGVQAAERYASPGGSGTACTKAQPCSLAEAVGAAKADDEVIVTAGSYSTTTSIASSFEEKNLYVHGDFGGPMPTISGKVEFLPALWIQGEGGRVSYLDVSNTTSESSALYCPSGGRVERVRTTAIGDFSTALTLSPGCVARDSLIKASGANVAAVVGYGNDGDTSVARNLTTFATGAESSAFRSVYNGIFTTGSYTLDLANVIASGEGNDLEAAQGIEGPGHITVSNSNFDVAVQKGSAKVSGSANQTASPQFVNAAGGDYRQATGSPTIDAGTTDQIGTLDLDGNPRAQGPAPDIGAFETFGTPPPLPAAGEIRSLRLKPSVFRTVNAGGAIVSAKRRPKKAPVGTAVTYFVSAPATVEFTVQRVTKGRKVGGKCKKATRANQDKKKCPLFRPLKPPFTHSGIHNGVVAGNSFRFSGRLGGKALRPGRYRLVGQAGDSVKRAAFRIVR